METEYTLDRAGNGIGMPTPWGRAQMTAIYKPGLMRVETAGRGGFLLSRQFAEEKLSEAGRKRGEEYGGWLAYEEDCAAGIIVYELSHLLENAEKVVDQEAVLASIAALERNFPGYLDELEAAATPSAPAV
jgi:hypothetical protein